MKIERRAIDSLRPYQNNAKIHTPEQIEQIKRSILEFGNNDPIAVDENDVVIEGHGRLQALQELGYTEVEVIRLTHLSEEQKKAYILVHNKLTMNTGFDPQMLEAELKSIDGINMEAYDFDLDFKITGDVSFTFTDDETDGVPEPPAEPKSHRGQIYQLGRHRLMCGDSTSAEDVDRLTEGREMDLCLTDPPYNVSYEEKTQSHHRFENKDRVQSSIRNDAMTEEGFYNFLVTFYEQMLRTLKPGGAFYIFYATRETKNFMAALEEAGGESRQILIWVKQRLVLGRQDYQWKHEPILYGWREGAHYFIADRCQTTVFEDRPDIDAMAPDELRKLARFLFDKLEAQPSDIIRADGPMKSDLHPTMKPVPLCAKLIQNSTRKQESVIDFFGGSGSTLMACEETGRTAYLMELDPRYVDAIIQRWEEATGERAVLINGN